MLKGLTGRSQDKKKKKTLKRLKELSTGTFGPVLLVFSGCCYQYDGSLSSRSAWGPHKKNDVS